MIDRRIGKIKVRRGKEIERKPLIFEEGELIYSIDKQRLFIGDGVLPGGILVSNRNYVVTSLGVVNKVIPATAMYGDIIHETSTNRTYIIGYESDLVTLRLILLADGNCCAILQSEIDDLYRRLRPLTACLTENAPTKEPPSNITFGWSIQPISVTVNVGETATLHAQAYGPSGIVYQWKKITSGNIPNAIGEYYTIPSVTVANQDNYICIATSYMGSITSNPASINIDGNCLLTELSEYILTENGDYIDWATNNIISPSITVQPRTQSTVALTDVSFQVEAIGSLPLTYQWRVNGVDIFGETNNIYVVKSPTRDILGITCKVSNIAGEVISNLANLTVGSLPAITKQPTGGIFSRGTKITLDVDAIGSTPLTYQWTHDNSSIAGATSDTYIINSASITDAGSYNCIVSNPYGSVTSDNASIFINTNVGIVDQIAVGAYHTLALGVDGTLSAWGSNSIGQLGDGTTTNRSTPVKINLPPIAQIAANSYSSFAVGVDGGLSAWGRNSDGQLGDGTMATRKTPIKINLPPIAKIVAGGSHSLVLGVDGILSAWGENSSGQLGDGTQISRKTSVKINLPPIVQIAAGDVHSLALGIDGTLSAWGANHYGQLGDGTQISRNTPVKINLPPVAKIFADATHSFALGVDGTLSAWGANDYGQLLNGTTLSSSSAVKINLPPVAQIASRDGYESVFRSIHTLALGVDGTLSAWGGSKGVGSTTVTYGSIVKINLPPVAKIAASNGVSFTIGVDGGLSAWGGNGYGQLGDGTTTDTLNPVKIF